MVLAIASRFVCLSSLLCIAQNCIELIEIFFVSYYYEHPNSKLQISNNQSKIITVG